MVNIRIFECAHDLKDRVDLTDVREELIPKSFPLACSFHKSRDVDEFDSSWDGFRTINSFSELFEALIIYIHDPCIRFDGTKRKIGRFGGIGFG